MSKFRENVEAAKRYAMAEIVASQWNLEYLHSRTPEDLMKSYGLKYEHAVKLLETQKNKRSRFKPL